MTDLTSPSPALIGLYGIGCIVLLYITLAKAVWPMWKSMRSGVSRVGGALDNIGGRDPFVDPATGKFVPGIPPIGERFTAIEKKLDSVADMSQWRDTVDSRLNAHELRIEDHDSTLGLIIGTTYQKGSEATLAAIKAKSDGAVDADPA